MDRPLRIALVVDPFRPRRRGADQPASLARELLGRGHVVRGFGARPGAIPRSGEEGEDLAGGLEGFGPEVIVAYEADSPAAWKGARAAGRLEVPLVLVEEGFPARGRSLGRVLRAVGVRLWGPLVRRRCTRAVALDPVARQQLVERGYRAELVEHVPPGVDLARYRPGLSSHLPGHHGVRGRVLLFLGGLHEEARVDRLLRAFAATVGRAAGWALVLAGEGPARPALRALAHRLGVGAQVHWLPPVRREELPGVFGAATLLLAPVDPGDVGSWRLRRALACGLPVLAARDLRSETIVEHDGCGLLVEGEDWTAALRLATSAPERRRRWGLRGRELAEARYAWPDVAARFERVLREVVSAPDPEGLPEPEAG